MTPLKMMISATSHQKTRRHRLIYIYIIYHISYIIYIYIYIYIFIYIYIYIYIHVHVHIYIYTCTCTCTYIYIHVCVYMCWIFWLIINVNFLGLEYLISIQTAGKKKKNATIIRHDLREVAIATAEDGEEVAHEDLLKTWMVQLTNMRMWPIKNIKIGIEPRNFDPWWSLDDLGGTRFWESFLVHPNSIPCFQASLWAEHGCGMLLVSLWYTLTASKYIAPMRNSQHCYCVTTIVKRMIV